MGKILCRIAANCVAVDPDKAYCENFVYASLDDLPEAPQAIVDFSYHTSASMLCRYAVSHGVPLVVATTGHTDDERDLFRQASAVVPVLTAGNMSLGVYALCRSAVSIAKQMDNPLVSIHEIHRLGKRDAPGGTAKEIASALRLALGKKGVVLGENDDPDLVGITYQRIGDTVGVHRVVLCDKYQRVDLCHAALSRTLFVYGALAAVEFVKTKTKGLYGMADLYRLANPEE